MELSPVEVRVLGCLIEKRATTPEHYPLSTNALVNACNQKTNRDPVTSYTEREIVAAMMELRAQKLCRTISSGRTDKHKHILDETFHFDEHQLAALAIMLLRGPQTPGEIRTRTERYVGFSSVDAVEQVLRDLAQLEEPLVVDLGRGPGQSQDRYMHLFGGPVDADVLSDARSGSTASASLSRTDRLAELEATVASLVERISRLEAELGLNPLAPLPSSENESRPGVGTSPQPKENANASS
ncbi:MAG: YceH family protein [Acidimicrobiales bacterium]|nr:YceH family protein [Acidimicrobiales bacterium]